MKTMLTLGAFLTVASMNSNAGSDTSLSGAELINNNCARCHNSRAIDEFSMDDWRVIMPHMREKAHLTGEEAKAILEFMEIATLPATQSAPTVVERASIDPTAVLTRYGCQGCHQIQGVGGTLGPALDGVIDKKGKAFFLRKVREPQFNNAASAMPKMPISDEELNALAEYLSTN